MKHIKEYKEIDWDNNDFDIEEEDPNRIHDDFIGNEEFYDFLYNNDVLDKFIENYDSTFSNNRNMTLKEFLNLNNTISYYILRSFNWSDSPQSHTFWERLSNKWRKQTIL